MIYFYWGGQRLSFLRYMSLYSACKFNKQVTLILRRQPLDKQSKAKGWKEKQDFSSYTGFDHSSDISILEKKMGLNVVSLEDFCEEVARLNYNDVHTSDLLSWYILAFHGGTVSDMDILYFKPQPEIEANVELIRYNGLPKAGYVPVSFMRSKAPCAFFSDMYKIALKIKPRAYESLGAFLFTPDVLERLSKKEVRWLDPRIVNPFAEKYKWKLYRSLLFESVAHLPEESVGVHWYAGGNQKYNNRITKENYWDRENRCTVTKLIKTVLEDGYL